MISKLRNRRDILQYEANVRIVFVQVDQSCTYTISSRQTKLVIDLDYFKDLNGLKSAKTNYSYQASLW